MVKFRHLLAAIFICSTLATICALAQSSLTQIRDTITNSDGTPFNGMVVITWNGFSVPSGTPVSQLSASASIYNGILSVLLVPTTTAAAGTYYQVIYTSSDGTVTWTETWQVPPSTTPLTISQVRQSTTQGSGGTTSGGTASGQYATLPIAISEVTDLSSSLSTINSAITNLNTEVSSIPTSSTLTTLQNTVSSLSTTVSGLSSTVGTLNSTVSGLSTTVGTLSGLPATVTTLGSTVSGISTTVTGLGSTTTGLSSSVGTLQTTVSGLSTTVNGLSSTTSGLSSTVSGLTTTANGLTSTVNGLSTSVSSNNTSIASLTSNLSSISSTVSGLSTSVTNLTNTVAGLVTTVNGLTSNGSSETFVDAEVPSGTQNGVNTTFNLANTPSPASSVTVYRNGLAQAAGVDYTLSGSVLTFLSVSVPLSTDTLQVFYRTPGTGTTTSNFVDAAVPSGAINGTNLVFTLASAPNPSTSLKLYKNGLLLSQGGDYTLSGTTITFKSAATAPQTGDALLASFRD